MVNAKIVDSEGFTIVRRRRKRVNNKELEHIGQVKPAAMPLKDCIAKIDQECRDLCISPGTIEYWFTLLSAVINEEDFENHEIPRQMTCLAIGSFTNSAVSRKQLALANLLKTTLNLPAQIYDPVMNEIDILVAEHYGYEFTLNPMLVPSSLVYMPRAPLSLYNSLFSQNISNVTIIGNNLFNMKLYYTESYFTDTFPEVEKVLTRIKQVKLELKDVAAFEGLVINWIFR